MTMKEKDNEMKMVTFSVEYTESGEPKSEDVEATNPGNAFATVLKSNPKVTLVRCYRQGAGAGGFGYSEWLPPKANRPITPEPRPYVLRKKGDPQTLPLVGI